MTTGGVSGLMRGPPVSLSLQRRQVAQRPVRGNISALCDLKSYSQITSGTRVA